MEGFDHKNPDYSSVLRERLRRLDYLRKTSDAWTTAKAFYAMPENAAQWIEDWCETYDPRKLDLPQMPFILFDRQREYLDWLSERMAQKQGGLVEKSRDMGLTWLNIAWSVWAWLFVPGIKISFGSRKLDLVDKLGDLDSILEKGRFIIRNLPIEFLPAGFDSTSDLAFTKFINRENGASITGEGWRQHRARRSLHDLFQGRERVL